MLDVGLEVGPRAGDEPVIARLQALGGGNLLNPLAEVGRRRQVGGPLQLRLLRQQGLPLRVGQPTAEKLPLLEPLQPIFADGAEMDLRDVAIADLDRRPRLVPHPLDDDADRLCLDLLDEVVAELSAGALGERPDARLGHFVRPGRIAFLIQDVGPFVPRHGGYLVIAVSGDEPLQGRLIPRRLLLAERLVVAEGQPRQVGVQKCRLVFVRLMEPQQVLVKPDRLDHGRPRVGGLEVPGDEVFCRTKDWAIRREFKGVFRLRRRLFAGTVEDQRLLGEEVVERRPIAVRQRPFVQQAVVLPDGNFLQFRGAGEGLGVVLVDLRKQPRQVPGGEILARRRGRRRPVHEPPAVVLEIVPIPVGQNDFHHRPHLRGRLGDFRLQADDLLLRVIALNNALQGNLAGDGLDGLGVGLFLDRPLDNGVQLFDGGLRQAFIDRLVHLFPLAFPILQPWRRSIGPVLRRAEAPRRGVSSWQTSFADAQA